MHYAEIIYVINWKSISKYVCVYVCVCDCVYKY